MRHRIQHQIKTIQHTFLQIENGHFDNLLCANRLTEFVAASGNYRDKIFTPLVTLNAFLWQTLSDNGGCKEAVARIFSERLQQQLPPNSVNTGPYCKARQRLSLHWIIQEVRRIGSTLHAKAGNTWTWRGFNVVLVDGTTVLLPDTAANQQAYPQQRVQKPGLGFPIARIVGLISLSAGTVMDYAMGPHQGKGTGEASLFSTLVDSLDSGDLLLADRYYSTYAILSLLSRKDVAFVSENHAQKKSNFKTGQKLGSKDHLIEWKKPKRKPVWMSKEDYATLPDRLTIRELAVNGTVYITTLLDANTYPKKAIVELYRERWKVELDFRTLKSDLKMEMLRCKTPDMVEKEIAVRFMAYNLIRGSMAESAYHCGRAPRDLSFKAAVQLLAAVNIQFYCSVAEFILRGYGALLKAIASTLIGQRKRPPQPRAVKRRPKPFPLLTEPRALACQRLREATSTS